MPHSRKPRNVVRLNHLGPCAEHGITKDEVEEVLDKATDTDVSRSSGRPVAFGDTQTGRHLMVVFELIDPDTVYPVSAYEVPRRHQP